MTCFSWLLSLAGVVIVMVSLLRWFEEITEAVDLGWWNKVFVLLAAPFSVWFFPAKVSAGRPSAVPHHEPVRGFGTVPLSPKDQPAAPARSDVPPAGTPKEFLGKPQIPPKKKSSKPAIDPEKIAKLKQKMREQGMLDEEP
jgi:hypothetical protein